MHEHKNMRNIIMSGASAVYGTTHVLARLWRSLVFETQVTTEQWDRLITDWTTARQNKGSDKDYTSRKGNITKQLAKNMITWNALIIGISILKYERMDIEITLHKKGRSRKLELQVDIETEVNKEEEM